MMPRDRILDPGDLRLDQGDGGLRPGEEGLEQDQHHAREHGKAPEPMRQHAIDTLGPRESRGRRDGDRLRHGCVHVRIPATDDLLIEIPSRLQRSAPDARGVCADGGVDAAQIVTRGVVQREQQPDGPGAGCGIRACGGRIVAQGGSELPDSCLSLDCEACRCGRGPSPLDSTADGCRQLAQTFTARRNDRNDLGADRRRERIERHMDALGRGIVHHAERHDDGYPGLDDFVGEVEAARERRRIGDDDDGIWRCGGAAEDCVDRDLLVA